MTATNLHLGYFLSDLMYTLRGQFIFLTLMVDHFAVVKAVAQHIPYAGLPNP